MRRVLILLTLLLSACDSSRVFEDNVDFENRSWVVENKVAFTFEITQPSSHYNLYYNIRNSIDFPYSRIFVKYTLSDSSASPLKKGLVFNYLFEPKTGEPEGSSALGDIYDHRFPLLSDYAFETRGKYTITLEQFNRADTLQGVVSAGVRVEHTMPPNK